MTTNTNWWPSKSTGCLVLLVVGISACGDAARDRSAAPPPALEPPASETAAQPALAAEPEATPPAPAVDAEPEQPSAEAPQLAAAAKAKAKSRKPHAVSAKPIAPVQRPEGAEPESGPQLLSDFGGRR